MGQGDCLSGKEIVKMDYNWKEGLVPSLFSKGMMSKGNFILEVWPWNALAKRKEQKGLFEERDWYGERDHD